MKSKYTQAQLAALAQLYREQEAEYHRLYAQADALLSEGNYVRRESVQADAGNKWWVMEGIKAAAEAIGIPSELLTATVTKGA